MHRRFEGPTMSAITISGFQNRKYLGKLETVANRPTHYVKVK